MAYEITTQSALRAAFWEHCGRPRTPKRKPHLDYPTDVRVEWVDSNNQTAKGNTMTIEKDETPVLFRKRFKRDDVTAVFPTIPADYAGNEMTCYAHIGQHGACSVGWYNQTQAAHPDEYTALMHELEGVGYRLKVYSRIPRAFHEERRSAARAYK
jgi:hypothetical protein